MRVNENGVLVRECEASKKYWNIPCNINRYNYSTIRKMREILESDKNVFYASDFDVDGGTMNALTNIRFVAVVNNEFESRFAFKPTGNSKTEMIEIGNDWYKKVEVNEWKVDKEIVRDFLEIYREEVTYALGE